MGRFIVATENPDPDAATLETVNAADPVLVMLVVWVTGEFMITFPKLRELGLGVRTPCWVAEEVAERGIESVGSAGALLRMVIPLLIVVAVVGV
jgi:hypothetical protein